MSIFGFVTGLIRMRALFEGESYSRIYGKYDMGLSNEVLFFIIAQRAANLWPVKVGDPEKIWGLDPGPHSSGLSGRILFRLPTLIGHSFAVP